MTTGQTMLTHARPAARRLCLALALLLAACAPKPRLTPPQELSAPYDVSRGEVLWGVVPLRNESGTSALDSISVSDKVVAAAAQVRGVRALPINRTIAAMRALKLTELKGPDDLKTLATEMGVDGLIVGSITAWDPYDPPKLGLALALYARPGAMERLAPQPLDTRKLEYQPTDYQYFPRSTYKEAPASVVSEYLDAKNHAVLQTLQAYALGRHDPTSAYGWKRYTASMDLFSEFAAWHAVSRLLDHEWVRLAGPPPQETKYPRRPRRRERRPAGGPGTIDR
jgi:hypothetical protein